MIFSPSLLYSAGTVLYCTYKPIPEEKALSLSLDGMQGTRSVEEEEEEEHWQEVGHRSPVSIANGYRPVLQGKSRGCPQSNELFRGPPELVHHFRF
jgi:hypothetical protein